ncbi:MAG: hypothetical protein AAGI52_15185 [Bacteroidota bacterium]
MSLRTLCAALILFGSSVAVAQSLPSWAEPSAPASSEAATSDLGPGPPPPPPPPPPVPVDGGLGLLALAGAGYAAHRLRRRRED